MHLGYVCQEDVVLWQLRRFDVNGVVVVVEVAAAGVLSCTRLLRIPANNSPKELYVVSVVRSSTSSASPTSSFTIISTSTAGLSELGATFHVLLREATRLQHAETNHLGE